MRIGDMLFKLYEKNQVMGSNELDEIKEDYRKWLAAEKEKPSNKVSAFVIKWQDQWYVRMVVAGFFMWAQRKVYEWMHPEYDEDEDEDDDDRD